MSELSSKVLTLISNLIANEIYKRNLQPNIIYRDYCDYSQRTFTEIINIFWEYAYSKFRGYFNSCR